LNKWRHLFTDGEFMTRERMLSGLTLEQVNERPSAHSHSIYEELWHTTKWQHIVVMRDEDEYAKWEANVLYPAEPPASEAEWSALVAEFLAGLEGALGWADSPEKLGTKLDPGVTMADALHSLAVHNAYHLGKIVAIRQAIGAWPPPERSKE
jgi:uncharacterized damage-inducible protein DinB